MENSSFAARTVAHRIGDTDGLTCGIGYGFPDLSGIPPVIEHERESQTDPTGISQYLAVIGARGVKQSSSHSNHGRIGRSILQPYTRYEVPT